MTNNPPALRQSTSNAVCRWQSRTCTATFTSPTADKALIVLSAVLGGGCGTQVIPPPGFVLIRDRTEDNLQVVVWYYEGAPPMNAVSVYANDDRSMQVRAIEYSGAAQTLALDRVTVYTDESGHCNSGDSGIIAQPDEIIYSLIANRYASTSQSGYRGGLTRLFESVSPQWWNNWWDSDDDEDRTRCTHHHAICNSYGSWRHECQLSSDRDWIAILCTFRGGSSGPKRMTSLLAPPIMATSGVTGHLSAFGIFTSTRAPVMLNTTVGNTAAMLPFNYQFRLNGLLLGQGTNFDVMSHDGLYGYQMRTSDDDQPRGDGSLRGVDLQSARQILFQLEVGGSQEELEQLLGVLYRTLIPQRDIDWELIWRHPAQEPRMVWCRPIQLPRAIDDKTSVLAPQKVALLCADPRHYSAVARRVYIPVTPAGVATPLLTTAHNDGDIPAYPVVRIVGPSSGPPVSRVELVNRAGQVTFDVALTLPARSVLIGDMGARVTGAPRSTITLDGQSKYGSWQLPRAPFRIDPAPFALNGDNDIFLRTTPPGAPVVCSLDYRDTWAG